jgi:hypothetical protein
MDNPYSVPIDFYIGETFSPLPITWIDSTCTPVNISGYSATLTARNTVNASNPAILLATTGNSQITVNGTLGQIQIVIGSGVTSTLSPFQGVWDLWVYSPSGVATRLVGGCINVREAVTR